MANLRSSAAAQCLEVALTVLTSQLSQWPLRTRLRPSDRRPAQLFPPLMQEAKISSAFRSSFRPIRYDGPRRGFISGGLNRRLGGRASRRSCSRSVPPGQQGTQSLSLGELQRAISARDPRTDQAGCRGGVSIGLRKHPIVNRQEMIDRQPAKV